MSPGLNSILDDLGVQHDVRKFNWIASLSSEVSIFLSWHSKSFTQHDNAKNREMIVMRRAWAPIVSFSPTSSTACLGQDSRWSPDVPAMPICFSPWSEARLTVMLGPSWSGLSSFKLEWIWYKKFNVM